MNAEAFPTRNERQSPNMISAPSPTLFQPRKPALKFLRDLLFSSVLALAALATVPARAQVAGAIAIYPENSSLEFGGSRQFSAYVPISPNTITWLVNDIPGGNTTVGTISSNGLYQSPAVIPAQNVVTIKAKSVAFPASAGSTSLTITRTYPWLWSVSPSKIQVGSYQVSFNGSNFAPDSKATANGVDVSTMYMSPTKLVVTGMAAAPGTINFAVRQPGPGAVTGNNVAVPVTVVTVSVAVSPGAANVPLGNNQPFTATVTGSTNTSVTWSVNGITGGSSTAGTISTAGVYAAPSMMPASATITIQATSVASPSSFGQAIVTLQPALPPVTVSVTPASATVQVGNSQAFAATVTGNTNTAVTWSVNGIVGGSPSIGTISPAGVYSAPSPLPASTSFTIRATSVASPSSFGQAIVTLTSMPPPAVWLNGARFLEQSSFGPTPQTLVKVQQMGIPAYLQEQFTLPETVIPTMGNQMGELRQWVLYNYTTAPDQLRQRVAYALGQIIVTSANKLIYPDEMLPWLRLLSQHAFGNYRDLLRDVTISPSMGKFLDLANSRKPGLSGGANENYAREIMQLFTIGLWTLNPDGSQATDANGQPISTYNQETVRQVALALTGWTYATVPGATPQSMNWEYFGAPMETRPQNHDMSAKSFLGWTLPAGQTVQQDLDGLLDCLMTHPNTAPFIATRLIRSLVMSNPSPGYIQRVAAVFANNGAGVRGDLKAVVTAILLDTEARQDNATVNQGRLKEPILQIAGLLRALNGKFNSGQQLTYLFDYMAQSILNPPSVFSWFSPLYHVPKSPLFGPEFQIYSPTEATLRGNFFHMVLNNPGGEMTIDLSPFQQYGNDMAGLVEASNQALLYGRMPAGMKQVLINAALPGYDAKTRIETVLYLTALSGQYAVQH
jgi:hypothetical protein